jgi:rhodanese-related sulfurtransferase
MLNIQGYDEIDDVLKKGTKALSVEEFEVLTEEDDIMILDTRAPEDFAQRFIPNAISIGIDGNFAVWVGTLVTDINQKIILVVDEGRENEVVTRLARVGYDNAIGYLEGGMDSWITSGKTVASISSISTQEFAKRAQENVNILDVRKESEYMSEHIVDAENMPLDFVYNNSQSLPQQDPYYVHCAGGYRSMIFASILHQKGYHNLINVEGGFDAIKASGDFELTEYVCPTTML